MKNRGGLSRLIQLVTTVLLAAAIYQELRKPAAERQWHGRVFGKVPYDFRVPTLDRVRDAYWNPDDPRLFTDRVLGVGWALNFYRLQAMIRGAIPRSAS
jgi:hypothetical protein